MSDVPVCPQHGSPLPPACPGCIDEMNARDVATMTNDERADELARWLDGILTVDFPDLHKRIEDLVGRPVWTHELAMPPSILIAEARTQQHPGNLAAHAVDSLRDVVGDKPIVVVESA